MRVTSFPMMANALQCSLHQTIGKPPPVVPIQHMQNAANSVWHAVHERRVLICDKRSSLTSLGKQIQGNPVIMRLDVARYCLRWDFCWSDFHLHIVQYRLSRGQT